MASYKRLRLAPAGTEFAWVRTTSTYSGNFTWTLTLQCGTRTSTNSWNVPTLHFKTSATIGQGTGYTVSIQPDGVQLQKDYSEVAAAWGFSYPIGNVHVVTVAMNNGTITVTVNGAQRISWTDSSPITSGYYGLDCLGIVAYYDEMSGTHINESFENFGSGQVFPTDSTFGAWTVGSSGGGVVSVESTGLRRVIVT